jgi:hypothetical protein
MPDEYAFEELDMDKGGVELLASLPAAFASPGGEGDW